MQLLVEVILKLANITITASERLALSPLNVTITLLFEVHEIFLRALAEATEQFLADLLDWLLILVRIHKFLDHGALLLVVSHDECFTLLVERSLLGLAQLELVIRSLALHLTLVILKLLLSLRLELIQFVSQVSTAKVTNSVRLIVLVLCLDRHLADDLVGFHGSCQVTELLLHLEELLLAQQLELLLARLIDSLVDNDQGLLLVAIRTWLATIDRTDLRIKAALQLLIKSLDHVVELSVIDIAFFVDELLGLITLHLQLADLTLGFARLSLLLE